MAAFSVSCPDEILRKSPKFSYLLTKLMEKLTPDGTSQHMRKNLELVRIVIKCYCNVMLFRDGELWCNKSN